MKQIFAKFALAVISAAWPKLIFTAEVNRKELEKFVDDAYKCGFLRKKFDIKNIFADQNRK